MQVNQSELNIGRLGQVKFLIREIVKSVGQIAEANPSMQDLAVLASQTKQTADSALETIKGVETYLHRQND